MLLLSFVSVALLVANGFCEAQLSPNNNNWPIIPPAPKPKDRKFPYQAGILLKVGSDESWCGGSLINNDYILTAAHCLDSVEEATVYLGTKNLDNAQLTYKIYKQNFTIHPQWNEADQVNDIALIKIPHTKYSDKIKPVKLPPSKHKIAVYVNKAVLTSGWGHVSNKSANIKDDLGYEILSVIRNKNCFAYYRTAIKDSNICASTYGIASTCAGDTGGPLVLEAEPVQVGILAFSSGKGCITDTPVVFTRVSAYLDWIKNNAFAAKRKRSG